VELQSAKLETGPDDISHPAEVSKPPAPPFSPAGPDRDDSGHAVVAFGGPELMGGPETAVPTTPTQGEPPAISVVETKSVDATLETKPPEIQATRPSESVPSDGRREDLAASTAAAWANWRDVRDSVLGPKNLPEPSPTEINSTVDLEELKNLKGLKKDEPTASPQPEAAMAAAAAAESSTTSDPNLSSIVDNMLAELKPKLMAELAEKLKKEKSKK
jgi:hypothetical protein